MLYLVFIVSKQGLGEDPPRDVVPRAPQPYSTPSLESGHGMIEGIELLYYTQTAYVLKTCALVRGPVSHLHAATAVGAGSVPEMIQGYRY